MVKVSAKYAKLFPNGSSQAVRLPKEFRFDRDKVRIRRVAEGVLLESAEFDWEAWFARMDHLGSSKMKRSTQPPIQKRKALDG